MLPKNYRLTKNSDFQKVYKKKRSTVTDLVVVYTARNNSQNTRVGFSASGKLGNAVVRNRTKRAARHAMRGLLEDIGNGYDIVVVARRKALGKSSTEVHRALRLALLRAGLLVNGKTEE